MKQHLTPLLLLCTTGLLIAGCQQKPSNILEFDAYLCSFKDKMCFEDPDVYKFKVRKFENQVVWNIFDSDGAPIESVHLQDCQIFDRRNWKCTLKGKSVDMIEGQLVTRHSEHRVLNDSEVLDKDLYFKYVPRK